MFAELRALDARAKLIITGTFLTSTALFMSIPFLSLVLLGYPGMTPTKIGVVIGISHLSSIVFGFVGGSLADRIGRGRVFGASLVGMVLVFVGFAFARAPLHFFVLNALNGLCQSLFRPASEALLSDSTQSEQRAQVFGYRYAAGNLGYTIGPALGGLCAEVGQSVGFLVSAVLFLAYALCAWPVFGRAEPSDADPRPVIPFREVVSILRKDHLMLLHIVGGVLVTLCFSQVTSSFAQFAKLELEHGVWLYSSVLTINTVLVLALQIPANRVLRGWRPMRAIMWGCTLYVVGFALMGLGKVSPALVIAAIVIVTCGEVLIVPTGSTLVDELAPRELKAAYFGAAQLRFAGMFIGPVVGGFLYERLGGPGSFALIGALSGVAAALYWAGSRWAGARALAGQAGVSASLG
jgi:MFS family permease